MMMMSGCRISQQLREYHPYRQFGICSSISSSSSSSNNSSNNNNNKYCRFVLYKKKGLRPYLPSSRFGFNSAHSSSSSNIFLGSSGTTNGSGSSSSCFSSEDLGGVSFFQQQQDDTSQPQPPVLSHCLSPAENGGRDPVGLSSVTGGIVALGKFDALHIGHRELAIQAAKIGLPFLLSFVGMAEVLGWEPRAPIVAKCDRKRVLSSWAPFCGNVIPKEFHVDFSKVRYLSPQQFVKKLSDELGVLGVVAGQNYRFGYKAAGDASDLVRLCNEYGMTACIINSVMDKNQDSRDIGSSNAKEQGQVSSTRVRHALASGDMKYVSELLGRHHRLMLMVKNKEKIFRDRGRISAPRSCLLNLAPKEGQYRNCSLVIGDMDTVPCGIIIDKVDIHLELDDLARINISDDNLGLLGIDFGDSKD